MQTASCPCDHLLCAKPSPATCWDLFLTVLLLWCGCQQEQPSPLGIQRVYCPVCLLPDTRCCHGYLWYREMCLENKCCFREQQPYRPHTPLLCWESAVLKISFTISPGVFHTVFLLEWNTTA